MLIAQSSCCLPHKHAKIGWGSGGRCRKASHLIVAEKRLLSHASGRARSSVAERPAHNRLVVGSNPAEPICFV
jgi:hypothetical protein